MNDCDDYGYSDFEDKCRDQDSQLRREMEVDRIAILHDIQMCELQDQWDAIHSQPRVYFERMPSGWYNMKIGEFSVVDNRDTYFETLVFFLDWCDGALNAIETAAQE